MKSSGSKKQKVFLWLKDSCLAHILKYIMIPSVYYADSYTYMDSQDCSTKQDAIWDAIWWGPDLLVGFY